MCVCLEGRKCKDECRIKEKLRTAGVGVNINEPEEVAGQVTGCEMPEKKMIGRS